MNPTPTLSIVLPAFNEEHTLIECVQHLRASLERLACPHEIILVDDGSSDRTPAIADELARTLPGVTAIHQANQGIGGAFRAGAHRARGEFVILWPADMIATPADLEPYCASLGKGDVVVGVRRARHGYNALMRLNAWIYPRLVRALFRLDVPDVNWIHAYRTSALQRIELTQRGIPMLVEILVRLRDNGARIVLVEVEMKARQHGTPSAARWSVMIRTLRGLFAFWFLWRREKRRPPHA